MTRFFYIIKYIYIESSNELLKKKYTGVYIYVQLLEWHLFLWGTETVNISTFVLLQLKEDRYLKKLLIKLCKWRDQKEHIWYNVKKIKKIITFNLDLNQ